MRRATRFSRSFSQFTLSPLFWSLEQASVTAKPRITSIRTKHILKPSRRLHCPSASYFPLWLVSILWQKLCKLGKIEGNVFCSDFFHQAQKQNIRLRLRNINQLLFVILTAINSSTNIQNVVKVSFQGAISSYIEKNLQIKCTIKYPKTVKIVESSNSLKNPFTRWKLPDLKVFGFKVSTFLSYSKYSDSNPVTLATEFVTNPKTNPVPKITGVRDFCSTVKTKKSEGNFFIK